ncbi:hypothetical protein PanWU01x14_363310 [Parasponia andersonii]|uniref:Uncharacterized protein n=1 Tax=Parasponia andersonii TaxID=3476 RepID=A0A2P5A6N2_PARAD|nr:hypothetical protein PanWU01x14_363310 [Parasponia andersonii]
MVAGVVVGDEKSETALMTFSVETAASSCTGPAAGHPGGTASSCQEVGGLNDGLGGGMASLGASAKSEQRESNDRREQGREERESEWEREPTWDK